MANRANIELLITTLRLQNCSLELESSPGVLFQVTDKDSLHELYLHNEVISKELKYILSQFEVLLRNRLNKVLSNNYFDEWIFEFRRHGFWGTDELAQIAKAEKRLNDLRKTITHDRVLAKLSLGFWLRVFNGPYYSKYIHDHMDEIFPRNKKSSVGISFGISDFRTIFSKISTVRNRVSHLEFILSPKYDVADLHNKIILIMKMMDKEYYDHFKAHDNFNKEMAELENIKRRIIAKHQTTIVTP